MHGSVPPRLSSGCRRVSVFRTEMHNIPGKASMLQTAWLKRVGRLWKCCFWRPREVYMSQKPSYRITVTPGQPSISWRIIMFRNLSRSFRRIVVDYTMYCGPVLMQNSDFRLPDDDICIPVWRSVSQSAAASEESRRLEVAINEVRLQCWKLFLWEYFMSMKSVRKTGHSSNFETWRAERFIRRIWLKPGTTFDAVVLIYARRTM